MPRPRRRELDGRNTSRTPSRKRQAATTGSAAPRRASIPPGTRRAPSPLRRSCPASRAPRSSRAGTNHSWARSTDLRDTRARHRLGAGSQVDHTQGVANGLNPLRGLPVCKGILDRGGRFQMLGGLLPVLLLERNFTGDEVIADAECTKASRTRRRCLPRESLAPRLGMPRVPGERSESPSSPRRRRRGPPATPRS